MTFSLIAKKLLSYLNHSATISEDSEDNHTRYLIGCSSISSFVAIPEAETYCATRAFQSQLFEQLSLRIDSMEGNRPVQVTLVETSVVWTDALSNNPLLKADPNTAETVQWLAHEPSEFAVNVLTQVFGGATYVLIGRLWWFLKLVKSLSFSWSSLV